MAVIRMSRSICTELFLPLLDKGCVTSKEPMAFVLLCRGGYCFETNMLLAQALKYAGFELYTAAGRVVQKRQSDKVSLLESVPCSHTRPEGMAFCLGDTMQVLHMKMCWSRIKANNGCHLLEDEAVNRQSVKSMPCVITSVEIHGRAAGYIGRLGSPSRPRPSAARLLGLWLWIWWFHPKSTRVIGWFQSKEDIRHTQKPKLFWKQW